MSSTELQAIIHRDSESRGYWAEIVQLPGCYAAGETRQELEEALEEAIRLYLQDERDVEVLTSDHVEGVERYRLSADFKLTPA